MSTFWRAGIWTSPTVVGRVVIRKKPITGLSRSDRLFEHVARHRRIVAQQLATAPVRAARLRSAKAMPLTVVSTPAERNERTNMAPSSGVRPAAVGSVVDRRADAVGA